jgi:hypothetical protein
MPRWHNLLQRSAGVDAGGTQMHRTAPSHSRNLVREVVIPVVSRFWNNEVVDDHFGTLATASGEL